MPQPANNAARLANAIRRAQVYLHTSQTLLEFGDPGGALTHVAAALDAALGLVNGPRLKRITATEETA